MYNWEALTVLPCLIRLFMPAMCVTELSKMDLVQIYGLSLVKLAVTLCLIGGTARLQPDGTRTRGEVHCLLVGDPGVGKSQFLR